MAISKDNNVKEGKKTAEKQVAEKKIRKPANSGPKRGQPTAAARLISSPYIKFGWHKPLSGETKMLIQLVSSTADSMYMLQIRRDRPIEALSLRNGIFWEHGQLEDASIVSTPALDHIDLFPIDDEAFQDALGKISKQCDGNQGFLLHYLFENLRSREFLVLPVQIGGNWVTIITKTKPKTQLNNDLGIDREVTDLAIVDPKPNGRESRRELINRRLLSILAEGCIEISTNAAIRDIIVPDLTESSHWQSGLVAFALSREFLRRLKVLQFRRSRATGSNDNEDFLWAPFEEQYNFDTYRKNLLSACAHQTIDTSDHKVRLALEVPSEDCNYQPSFLRNGGVLTHRDEKWDIFQSPTHTFTIVPPGPVDSGTSNLEHESNCTVEGPRLPNLPEFTSPSYTSKSTSEPVSPSYSPTSLQPNRPSSPSYSPSSPGFTPEYSPISPSHPPTSLQPNTSPSCTPTSPNDSPSESPVCLSSADANRRIAPIAPMGRLELSPQIPSLTAISSPEPGKSSEPLAEDQSASQPQQTPRKRRFSEDGDVEAPPQKRLKTEDDL